MGFLFTKLVRNVVLLVIFFNAVQFLLKWKSYNISVKDFKSIAAKTAGADANVAVAHLASDLRKTYKERIPHDLQWVPLSAGGLHLRAQFLYADTTEYIAVFAAAGNTIGRSGFHWSNNTCTVLNGKVARYSDAVNGIVKETFASGQNFRHGQFESYIYELESGVHVACYGRGFVPASSLWAYTGALADGDPLAAARVTYVYGKAALDNFVRSITSIFHHYKQKVTKFEL